jgi:hypothetical protein
MCVLTVLLGSREVVVSDGGSKAKGKERGNGKGIR